MSASPEPLLTLEEACRRYFPGKSACALRWMIKRKGYAHSRWGREYRLTPSQVAAIMDDLAQPSIPAATVALRPSAVSRRARPAGRMTQAKEAPTSAAPRRGGAADGQPAGPRRVLEERLSAPLSETTT